MMNAFKLLPLKFFDKIDVTYAYVLTKLFTLFLQVTNVKRKISDEIN